MGEDLVEMVLGVWFAVADVQRQSSGATDRWLDNRIVRAVESHQLTKIGNVLFGLDNGGHDRNAGAGGVRPSSACAGSSAPTTSG